MCAYRLESERFPARFGDAYEHTSNIKEGEQWQKPHYSR